MLPRHQETHPDGKDVCAQGPAETRVIEDKHSADKVKDVVLECDIVYKEGGV